MMEDPDADPYLLLTDPDPGEITDKFTFRLRRVRHPPLTPSTSCLGLRAATRLLSPPPHHSTSHTTM